MAIVWCYRAIFISVFFISFGHTTNVSRNNSEVHFLLTASFTGIFKTWNFFSNVTQLAIDTINNRSDILHGFEIVPHYMDSKCLVGHALHEMYKELYTPPTKIFIVGPTCSDCCKAMAETSYLWNISMVTATCLDPGLENRSKYPRFFRTSAPDTALTYTRLELMKLYNWKKIALVHSAVGPFEAVTIHTRQQTEGTDVVILTSEVVNNDPKLQIENLKRHDSRIIIGGMFYSLAISVFCEAYKLGFYGSHIVWLLPGWWDEDWWSQNEGATDCTPEQLLETVQDFIYISSMTRNPFDTPSLSGYVQSDIDRLVFGWMNNTKAEGSYIVSAALFDAVMAAAIALNSTESKLRRRGDTRSIADFTYQDYDMGDLILSSMQEVTFQGVKGLVDFDKTGGIHANLEIFQQKGAEKRRVGWHDRHTNILHWENGGITWRDGAWPFDSTEIQLMRIFASDSLYYSICGFAGVGILLNLAFLGFNLYFRNIRIIKMSSRNINSLILVGCMVLYVTVILELRPQHRASGNIMCSLKTVAFTLGFSVAFGGLFSKTWRVHRIMTNAAKGPKKTVIRDVQLFLIVGGLVAVDAIVLVTWQVFDPYEVRVNNMTERVSFCSSEYTMYFQGALFVIQGLMMAFGAFLAWETRKVTIPALNDSKLIGICIYNVTILSILGAAISMVIENNPNASYGFSSGFILAGTFLTSVMLVVPKVLSVTRGDTDEPTRTTFQTADQSHNQTETATISIPGSQNGAQSPTGTHGTVAFNNRYHSTGRKTTAFHGRDACHYGTTLTPIQTK